MTHFTTELEKTQVLLKLSREYVAIKDKRIENLQEQIENLQNKIDLYEKRLHELDAL